MNESRATRYQRLKRRARGAGLLSAELVLALIVFTPLARLLAAWSDAAARGLTGAAHGAVALLCFVAILVALWELAAFPAACVAVKVDGAYGRAAPAIEDVLGAQAQATLVALPAALVSGAVVLTSVRLAGPWWWALAAVFAAGVLAAAVGVGPAIFERLARARPIGRPDLARRLEDLARRARVPVAGIDEWPAGDNDRRSALVTGVGASRRVLLSSEMARQWPDDEVVVVVAHELAHHAYHDLWRTLGLDAALILAGLFAADRLRAVFGAGIGLDRAVDLGALPFIALVASLTWVAFTPLRHAQSRRHERRADLFALALTGSSGAFAAAVRRLGARHMAEERPSALTRWLYYTHPSVSERLALADTYGRLAGKVRDQPIAKEREAQHRIGD